MLGSDVNGAIFRALYFWSISLQCPQVPTDIGEQSMNDAPKNFKAISIFLTDLCLPKYQPPPLLGCDSKTRLW